MRRPLLTLLALLVLLMQPAALLHALSHEPGGAHAAAAASSATQDRTDADGADGPAGLDCLQCLAFAALGGAALPFTLRLFRRPLLRHAAPCGPGRVLGAGTGAGYHARGPPALA